MVGRELDERLLLAIRATSTSRRVRCIFARHIPDERVHLHSLNVVELLDGLLDLWRREQGPTFSAISACLVLVCTAVNEEHNGVVLLDLLEGSLCNAAR